MTAPRIIRNRAKCCLCGDTVESKHRHDYRSCRCGALSVDGGLDYLKRGYSGGGEGFLELSEYEQDVTGEPV